MSNRVFGSRSTWADAQAGARALSPIGDPLQRLALVLVAADAAVVLAASAGAWMLRHGAGPLPIEVVAISMFAVALTVYAMRVSGAYGRHLAAGAASQVTRALRGWSVVWAALLLIAFMTKTSDEFSRVWSVGWYGLALLGFASTRVLAAARVRQLQAGGRLAHTVAIVDLAGDGEQLTREILQHGAGQIHLVGVFAARAAPGRRNGVADLVALSRLFRISEVIVVVPGRRARGMTGTEIDAVLRRLGTIPTNVRLCPELPAIAMPTLSAGMLFGQPMLTVCHRPLTGWNRVVKRQEDLMLGIVALVLLSPFMAAAAMAVKLSSPGPALFRQKRLGFNNNVIVIYKFRSMTHNRPDEPGVPQARRTDPRVTRVGRFLRRTSIDELPQLFNVLKGEMSLVGPRPHALAHNEEYAALIDDYLGRHRVQPGITGWAQVNGFRGETDTLDKMQRRVEHDLAYIDRWSLLFDLRIIMLTVLRSVFDRNAY